MPDAAVATKAGLVAYFAGPELPEGPLPTLVYFGASGEETLEEHPFNYPVAPFLSLGGRVLSFDLPYHHKGADKKEAIQQWVLELQHGRDVITPYVSQVENALHELARAGWIAEDKIAFCGLSRGGFVAGHLAARFAGVRALLGFAPVTKITGSISFHSVADTPLAEKLNLHHLAPSLAKTSVRFYIGNRDVMVGTKNAFDFIELLAEEGFAAGERSPKAELIISPSIGHKGHGTPTHIFEEGARWAHKMLQ